MTIRLNLTALLLCCGYGTAQSPAPTLTTIYNFASSNGGGPSPLAIGQGGVLYGTTSAGGAYGYGTVFSLTPPASPGGSWTYAVIYNFQGASDGADPISRLTIGAGGVLYGATGYAFGSTEIYSLTPPASPGGQWSLAVIASFGATALSSVAVGPAGVLFATTADGPSAGTVFALAPPESPRGSWTERTLKNFAPDGGSPAGGLALGSGPVLYGTFYGGEWASVFALTPPAAPGRAWTETVLYQFIGTGYGQPTDVVIGDSGVLYGTVYPQGSGNGGEVYSLTPPVSEGESWTHATLYHFPPPHGDEAGPYPTGSLALGEHGTLYGTTLEGGASRLGTAYALEPPASPGGAWTPILLHSFTGSDGLNPTGLTIGEGGILYGTTTKGGTYGYGTVFALTL